MNKLGQFGIILGLLFLGQFLQLKFNLPIPGTIMGMLLLFVFMFFKIIKLSWVEDIGNILLDNLSLLFIPAGVGLIRELDVFKGQIINLAIIILISTMVVIIVTGYTVQILENKRRSKNI